MSEARNGRFEIDLDEIEKQLRRSVEQAPPPKSDPLAELARIVGQDDPFRGLFANAPERAGGNAAPPVVSPGLRPGQERGFTPGRAPVQEVPAAAAAAQLSAHRDAEAVLHGPDDVFDPVGDAYGAPESAYESEGFSPLPPRRSRKKLVTVGTLVVVAVVGTAGTLAWRNGTGRFAGNGGAPPIIKADSAPLKVAPENPGGMEIPNQNKQIYERAAPESQTRVVDQREQPIDVKEAARSLPTAPPPPADTPAPVAPSSPPVTADSTAPAGDVAADPARRPSRSNALASALGEPRRVRTVSVRPDGTLFDAPPAPALANPTPTLVPAAGTLPPPVQVATIPISIGGTASTSPSATAPAAQPPAAASPATGATPTGPVATVLPPQRPRPDGRSATPDTRVATNAPAPEAAAPATTAGTTRAYSVQLGIRPSEQDAQTAAAQLATKYAADLGGRSPAVARAEVSGRTVYRMRVGPMSRDEANALCTKLKGSGGQCFVALN